MTDWAELEIGLHRRDADAYTVELRFSQPKSDTVDLVRSDLPPGCFDLDRLRELLLDDAAYGQLLVQSLLVDAGPRTFFAKARSTAQALDVPLRLRLFVGPGASELHSLRWETARDPEDGCLLFTGEQILFSRYLSSSDWQPVGLCPQGDLRALVVVADPNDLSDYRPGGRPLAPVDVDGELARAKAGLGDIPVTALVSGSARLDEIAARLRDGYDILYLVCHGALVKGEPHLFLEDEAGKVEVVGGAELVARVAEMRRKPRLVVLASCQSAGTGAEAHSDDSGALAALGPRLAEAGVPAVLAMQGNVAMETVARFMPVFFRELQRDGQIDRAAAVARGTVRDQPDWWAPVLFMRLKSGRLWYTPGFGEGRPEMEKWPALLHWIRQGKCTPILGPGLTEPMLGARRQIARRWAEQYHFPMKAHDRENMPQVAQYLAVNLDPMFPRSELAEYVRGEIVQTYGADLAEEVRRAPLNDLIAAVGARQRARDPAEAHRVLAQLPLPIFVTAEFCTMLAEALSEAGKDPQVETCRWNEMLETLPSVYDAEATYRPEAQRPLVYHLFGHLKVPDSIVLTEDDYFDYLIGVTGNKDLIPGVVRRALADTALLFLGFRMDEWDFRVLYRSLMSQEGRSRRSRYAHVAVQVDPEEGRILEPERARRYLESYFRGEDISVYWGSADDFVKELWKRWERGDQ